MSSLREALSVKTQPVCSHLGLLQDAMLFVSGTRLYPEHQSEDTAYLSVLSVFRLAPLDLYTGGHTQQRAASSLLKLV